MEKGQLTVKGRRENSKIGAKRKQEYQKEKKLIGPKFNPNSIISLSISEDRSSESASHILQAMYPLYNLAYTREINYLTYFSPLKGTTLEEVL